MTRAKKAPVKKPVAEVQEAPMSLEEKLELDADQVDAEIDMDPPKRGKRYSPKRKADLNPSLHSLNQIAQKTSADQKAVAKRLEGAMATARDAELEAIAAESE